ncbi:hypothetical protein [Thiolapillus sp.]|uniref:hypothetical protein n=2 Tax=Thiolapillus sp. TaxID=2017437 RepID=UPI003AF9CF13
MRNTLGRVFSPILSRSTSLTFLAFRRFIVQPGINPNLTDYQACLRPRDRFWDIPVPKIDSAFDNLFVPQPSWSPSTTQQLRKLVAAPYLSPNDWTPRLDAYFASPLALCARRVSSAASRLLGSTSLRFALHGWQRRPPRPADSERR